MFHSADDVLRSLAMGMKTWWKGVGANVGYLHTILYMTCWKLGNYGGKYILCILENIGQLVFIFFETPKTRPSAPPWHDFCEDPVATRMQHDAPVAAWLRGAVGVGRWAFRVRCYRRIRWKTWTLWNCSSKALPMASFNCPLVFGCFWGVDWNILKPWIYSEVKAVKAN